MSNEKDEQQTLRCTLSLPPSLPPFPTLLSLYALAPLKALPSIIDTGILAPSSMPFKSPRDARGQTNAPAMVLSLPVMEPTMMHRGSLAFFKSSIRRETNKKCDRWLICNDSSIPSGVKVGVGRAGRYTAALQTKASRGLPPLTAFTSLANLRTESKEDKSRERMVNKEGSRFNSSATRCILATSRTPQITK